MTLVSKSIGASPFADQKPGTSGLRKPTLRFMEKNYVEMFVQSILNSVGPQLDGCTLVVGGDGRFFVKEAALTIIRMCAANKVKHVIVGENGIFSTPCVSCVIRKRKTLGGIILTASHNPGGKDKDFGIKFNTSNGGPAPDAVTSKIFDISKGLKEYNICMDLNVDISKQGTHNFTVDGRNFTVEIVDPVTPYIEMLNEIFDFGLIKKLLTNGKFKMLIDCLHGVTGPYAKRLFVDTLGASPDSVVNFVTLPDFGGGHPDPNLVYAHDLVKSMEKGVHDFGAAFDGDGDRNMILGKNAFFVTPSDSLAVLVNNVVQCVPYFKTNGIKGLARSMPTAGAVDRVAHALKKPMYEVPTGWKYFGNLMDAGRLSICGEESFGTGSDHIREKDGIWAAVAWLSVLAHTNESVENLLKAHWKVYGRNFFTRYDYENCASDPANQMMAALEARIAGEAFKTTSFTAPGGKTFKVAMADNFQYTDPVDGSVATKQGIRIVFADGSRIVYRLSGTGSSGATVRIYIDSYQAPGDDCHKSAQEMLKPLVSVALSLSELKRFLNRDAPTVIT